MTRRPGIARRRGGQEKDEVESQRSWEEPSAGHLPGSSLFGLALVIHSRRPRFQARQSLLYEWFDGIDVCRMVVLL